MINGNNIETLKPMLKITEMVPYLKNKNIKFELISEQEAEKYLKDNKYEIIENNYYTRNGEIDIIASKNNYIIFVEVKTRTNEKYGRASEAVNKIKKIHMKKSAAIFLKENNFSRFTIRFDVIEVYMINGKCKINHIKQIIWKITYKLALKIAKY